MLSSEADAVCNASECVVLAEFHCAVAKKMPEILAVAQSSSCFSLHLENQISLRCTTYTQTEANTQALIEI